MFRAVFTAVLLLTLAAFGAAAQIGFPFPGPGRSALGTWLTSAGPVAFGSDAAGWGDYTMVEIIATAQVSNTGGSQIRVTYNAATALAYTTDSEFIGACASNGQPDATPSFAGTPSQLLFNSGSASMTLTAGTSKVSDALAFVLPAATDLCIAHNLNSATLWRTSSVTGWRNSYKAGRGDAATVTKAGYTAAGATFAAQIISLVETFH